MFISEKNTIFAHKLGVSRLCEWKIMKKINIFMKKHLLLIALLGIGSVSMWAGPIDCSELEGLGNTKLLAKLNEKISKHSKLDYRDTWAYKSRIDIDSKGKIIDMYSDCSLGSNEYCNNSNFDTEEFCECYNREHSLPKSFWGGSTSEPMYTDVVHVIPIDNATNSKRSAWAYGVVSKNVTWSNDVGSKLGSNGSYTVFEPQDEYKGDIARIYFYMLTCYQDKDFTKGGQGSRCFTYNNGVAGFMPAFQNLLLTWHRNDPVSDREQTRNNRIETYQGNRNPYVDNPDLIEYIWGNKKRQTYSCGTPTDEEDVEVKIRISKKVIINGRLYIKVDDAMYDIMGNKVANF